MFFYTGTHRQEWLWKHPENWFVSNNRLRTVRKLFPAVKNWALDSGGFTELSLHGTWTKSPTNYAADIRRYTNEIGKLDWAAPQDWMCEEHVLAKTGKSVSEHQRLTIESVLELRQLLGSNLVVPVLQGWQPTDYLRHVDMYQASGFSLSAEPVVGIGSVCRRQNVQPVLDIIQKLASNGGVKIHAFGFKKTGIRAVGQYLASSDSLAWSFEARRTQIALPGHTHKNCANCIDYAQRWTQELKAQFPCITN